MNDAIRAHIRLLESIPQDRITTHYCKDDYLEREVGKPIGPIPDQLVAEVQQMHLRGMTQTAICRELGLGGKTYERIRKIMSQRLSYAERQAMVWEMLSRGVSERSAAAATGLSRTSIQKYKRRMREAA